MSNKNYPTAWPEFIAQSRLYKDDPTIDQLIGDFGTLSRWAARFRLAKSFRGIDVGEAYGSIDTPLMYSAIVRIFLVYSSFETYCKVLEINPGHECQVKSLQDEFLQRDSAHQSALEEIRALDRDYKLCQFLENHLCSRTVKEMMRGFIQGENVNISFLAKSIRHVFAHGVLTANSGGLSAKRFDRISQKISHFLLDCMDSDFADRISRES